ncbi:hypothetical protein AURDEDRAFT_179643, partial [Auricularia subglabra TFB-10046 SS5]
MNSATDVDRDSLELFLAEYHDCYSASKFSTLLPELLDKPLNLELVLSATEAPAACIRAAFPTSQLLLTTALHGQYPSLIARLARVPQLPLPFDRDMIRDLDVASKDIVAALDALAALRDASFASDGGCGTADDSPKDEEPAPFMKARQKQGSKKRAQRAAAASSKPALDPKPFKELGADVPNSQLAADELSAQILTLLKDRSMNMLACLKLPECVEALERAYLESRKPDAAPTQLKLVQVEEEPPTAGAEAAADTPSTPEAESIRPALYFDNAGNFGPWRIRISSRADRDLRELHRGDAKMFKIVMKKIKELSCGHFSDDNQKRLTGKDTAVPVFEAKMTRDTRLVYYVDIVSEYGSSDEHQVLSIYGIYSHKQLARGAFWTAVGSQLSRSKGAEYRRRCIHRSDPAHKNDKVYLPMSFPLRSARDDNSVDLGAQAISIPQEDQDELHELLDLEKFVVFSQALLNSILADIDVTHPFETSSDEKRIIEHPYSCYVMGRSGTGKTTTMVFKMLGHERAWRMRKDTVRKPRQLFVTQSPMLAGKVEDYFRKLLDSLEISDYKAKELLNHDHLRVKLTSHRQVLPDDDTYGSELPRRFSQLEDQHFPLFTTFEKLSQLIEADVDASGQSPATQTAEEMPVPTKGNAKRTQVTYQTFRSRYWPHFSEHLTKGLDPALVYSEIMGVVKGSEESLYHGKGSLDAETYKNYSARRQSTFASERTRVYDIFSAYERRRIEHGHTDVADRAHTIIRALKDDKTIIGQRVNFLYVDEAQDNLLVDAMVLRMICSNPRGLFWAGDTAQTISVGSSFRFNDLRAFLHRVEEARSAELSTVGAPLPTRDGNPPALFQLLVNYRSHGGIISCAQAVISLLSKFWPDSIDNLGEERGVVAGAKPIFLGSWDPTITRPEHSLFGPDNKIEFGARQCIIVRSEEAQIKLRREAGDIGIVMTVYESKGLEFDDVLLYNFFDDSTVNVNQWRVVLNAVSDDAGSLAAPRFDDIRHAGVCAELKSLYVAITRARKKLWIFDRSEKGEPMKVVWKLRDLVQIGSLAAAPKFAVSSTQVEWQEQARTLFAHELYSQARHCFERAGDPQMAAVADAYYLRACAYLKPLGASKTQQDERAKALVLAGRALERCALSAESDRPGYFWHAGECFEEAGRTHFPRAAKCFEQCEQYVLAANLYRDVGNFDDAVRVVWSHWQELSSNDDAVRIINTARLLYYKDDMRESCPFFEEPDEAVEFLEERGLDTAQAAVLETMGRWSAAAEVHLQEGRVLAAAAAYMRSTDTESASLARAVILRALWGAIALGRKLRSDNEDVLRLRQLISQLCERGFAGGTSDEIQLFDSLLALNNDPQALQSFIHTLRVRSSRSEQLSSILLLALHAFLTSVEHKSGEDLVTLGARLDMTLNYVRLLRDRMTDGNATANPVVQQLFGFRVHSDRTFIVLFGTHLHREAVTTLQLSEVGDGVIILENELASVYKASLLKLIQSKVDELKGMLEQDRALSEPCLRVFFDGACTWDDCQRVHIAKNDYTADHYNRRVRAHVAILSILATVDGIVDRDTVVFQERTWTRRLYDALRPIAPSLGNPALLDMARILPQESRTGGVLHAWVRPHLYNLRVRSENIYTYVMQCAWICSAFNTDRADAAATMYGAPIVKDADYARGRVSAAGSETMSARDRIRMANSNDAPLLLKYMLNGALAPNEEKRSFLHGVEFFSRLLDPALENGPGVDIGVICNYFEDLSACLIMSWHLGYTTPIMLPLSWCLSALRRSLANRFNSIAHLKRLVDSAGRLISLLREPKEGAQALWYHGKPLTAQSPKLPVNLIIARMCRGLCLLAYNFDMDFSRKRILGITRELRWRSRGTAYESYARARDWSDLRTTVEQSLAGSHLDCMVWVARRRGLRQSSIPSCPNVIPVLFKTFDDLSEKLRAIVPGQPQALNAESNATSPTGLSHQPEPLRQRAHTPDRFAVDETAINDSDSELGGDEPNADNQPADHAAATLDTAKHDAAAILIQRAFRRRFACGARDGAHSYFRICLAASRTDLSESSSGYYRKLFLGPLPHVLACLQRAETQVHEIKTTLKEELKTAEGRTLDQLDNQLTAATRAYKRIHVFRRKLEPGAVFYVQRDVSCLERIVDDINQFIRGLPAVLGGKFDPSNITGDLATGW